jgi:hypothetical protein
MALPTGGYSYSPQTANLGASPLSALKPLDVGVSVQFTPMPKYEVPSAQQELVSMGAAKGFQGFAEPIIKAFKDKEEERKAGIALTTEHERAVEIARIKAEKTPEEKEYEDLRIQNLEKTLDEKGANKGTDINYGSFEDETPVGNSDLPTNEDADVSNQPSLFNINEVESSDFLGQINPTQERVAALWNTPLAELTASAGTAGAQQEQALASMGAGTLTPAGQVMSTDTQPQATAPEEPRFGLMSKFRGLYTPEEAKKMRAEFSGKMEEFSGDGKMEPVPSAVEYQFDKPMRDVAPIRVEKAIPVGQASQATAKPTRKDLSRYIQNWSDPSVAASAVDKIAEIMGSEYAYPEIIDIKDKNGNIIGYRPEIPKKLTRKELAESKTSTEPSFKDEKELRQEYLGLTKDYKIIQSAWRSIRSAGERKETDPPSPASDMALIFGFMKLLDPTSTVREGEYATAQNATGIPGRVANAYNKAIDGVILNIDQRNDFLRQSKKQYDARLGEYKELKTTYTKLAKRKGFDPENVVLEFNISEEVVSDIENLTNAAITLTRQLAGLPEGSPEKAKVKQDLIVIRGKIVEANNAGK